jgi:hypothetical protein
MVMMMMMIDGNIVVDDDDDDIPLLLKVLASSWGKWFRRITGTTTVMRLALRYASLSLSSIS